MIKDHLNWKVVWGVERRDADVDAYRTLYGREEGERRFFADHRATSIDEVPGNLLMTLGASALISALIGTAGLTAFSNTNARIGVGDSTTAAAAGQTDLQAASNKLRKAMDATFPLHTAGTNTVRFQATFGSSEANWQWNEFAVFNGATATSTPNAAGLMLNRKVPSPNLGTKTTGSWTLFIDITLS